jgi:hypothetical protein
MGEHHVKDTCGTSIAITSNTGVTITFRKKMMLGSKFGKTQAFVWSEVADALGVEVQTSRLATTTTTQTPPKRTTKSINPTGCSREFSLSLRLALPE